MVVILILMVGMKNIEVLIVRDNPKVIHSNGTFFYCLYFHFEKLVGDLMLRNLVVG